jgi:Cu/Zn superoxide dismutase
MKTRSVARAVPRMLIGAAVVVLALTAPAAAGGPSTRVRSAGPLRDLVPASAQPTDHAAARVTATQSGGSTTVTLRVLGLDHAAAGTVLGAHVHVGSCVAGDGAAAGPHYNAGGGISESTEVWLDFTIEKNGTGFAKTTVPFIIPAGGAGAVVIHAQHTDHTTGAAGPRWACLPVPF